MTIHAVPIGDQQCDICGGSLTRDRRGNLQPVFFNVEITPVVLNLSSVVSPDGTPSPNLFTSVDFTNQDALFICSACAAREPTVRLLNKLEDDRLQQAKERAATMRQLRASKKPYMENDEDDDE